MSLAANELQQRARTLTGLNLDDAEVEQPLRVLVDSLNREAELTVAGEKAIEEMLVRHLANRLRMERDFMAHPEIADEQIVAPIFVYGLPRSGTTKMQKLLSVTGDATELPFWMAHNPSLISGNRDEDPVPRIEDAERYCRWAEQASPTVKRIHPFATHEPEEVNPILEQAFQTFWWAGLAEVPSYLAWLMAQDPHPPIRYLRRVLQYLQWQFEIDPGKPWALKNPLFVGMEPVIKQVFPDACLVMTHRHPATCVASTISLQSGFHKLYSDIDINPPGIAVTASSGFMLMENLAAAARQSAANRAAFPDLGIVDIAYAELTRDSIAVVEQVYRHIGKPLTDVARGRIAEWESRNRQHKHGAHHYSLAQYRLTEEMVTQRFADYISDYGRYF